MVITTEHDISELDQQLAKVYAMRAMCADPEVEVIDVLSYPTNEVAIIATWHLGIQAANPEVTAAFMAALAPKPENVTHTDWHTFTHRRDLEKVTCYLSPRQMETVSDIADSDESSIEAAIGWLIDRHRRELEEDDDA